MGNFLYSLFFQIMTTICIKWPLYLTVVFTPHILKRLFHPLYSMDEMIFAFCIIFQWTTFIFMFDLYFPLLLYYMEIIKLLRENMIPLILFLKILRKGLSLLLIIVLIFTPCNAIFEWSLV